MKIVLYTQLYHEFYNCIYGWTRLSDAKLRELVPIAEEKAKDLTGVELLNANNMLEAMRFCVKDQEHDSKDLHSKTKSISKS